MHPQDIELTPYSRFRPTGHDTAGLSLPERQDWLVAPCAVNRDSDLLTRCNWEEQAEELETIDEDGNDHEVHRFGHWACGWFEVVLVRPGSACHIMAQQIEASIASYPVLSEDRYSNMQHDEESEAWENYEAASFAQELALHYELEGDALEDIPADTLFSAWYDAVEKAGAGWSTEWNYDGPRFNFTPEVLAAVDIEALKQPKSETSETTKED